MVCAASTPPAPGRASTTTGCPRNSPIFWPMTRIIVSAVPPPGKVDMTRTGFTGKDGTFCASLVDATVKLRMIAGKTRRRQLRDKRGIDEEVIRGLEKSREPALYLRCP